MPASTARSLASKSEQSKLNSMYSKTQKKSGFGSGFGTLVTLAINIAIIYYVLGLEKDKCKCVRDWRHDYIKYYTGVMIFITVVRLLGGNISIYTNGPDSIQRIVATVAMLVAIAIVAAVGVQIYAIFTYVGDLNKTKCICATDDMRTLNRAMLVLRWVYVIGAVLTTLLLLFVLGGVGLRLLF